MDREAIAYMLFISSALYLKERNIKPFCQEALYIYCKRWHLLQQKMPPFVRETAKIRKVSLNEVSERT